MMIRFDNRLSFFVNTIFVFFKIFHSSPCTYLGGEDAQIQGEKVGQKQNIQKQTKIRKFKNPKTFENFKNSKTFENP